MRFDPKTSVVYGWKNSCTEENGVSNDDRSAQLLSQGARRLSAVYVHVQGGRAGLSRRCGV